MYETNLLICVVLVPHSVDVDLQMPVMDGLEATKRLRLHELEAGIDVDSRQKIIGISANVNEETACEVLQAGMNAFIPKPFTIDKLKDVCRELKIYIF
jgi:CheY-like chemotaxis protein